MVMEEDRMKMGIFTTQAQMQTVYGWYEMNEVSCEIITKQVGTWDEVLHMDGTWFHNFADAKREARRLLDRKIDLLKWAKRRLIEQKE